MATMISTTVFRRGAALLLGVTAFGVLPAVTTVSAAPATCGDAIDVPLIGLVADVLVYQAEVIEEPGAKMSRQLP